MNSNEKLIINIKINDDVRIFEFRAITPFLVKKIITQNIVIWILKKGLDKIIAVVHMRIFSKVDEVLNKRLFFARTPPNKIVSSN